MTDIVERLREPGQCISDVGCNDGLMREAADEIERLREEIRTIYRSYEWWSVDPYDRCGSVVADSIHEAYERLEAKP